MDIGFFWSTRLIDRNKEKGVGHTQGRTTHTHTQKAKEIYINTTMVNPHHSDSLFFCYLSVG